MGKSTAALLIGKRHEKAERRRLARIDDASFAPMVYAVVLPATTPRMLIQAFASWFGLPVPQRSTAQLATEHVVGVLRTLGTSLVIVDEVHNLTTNRQAGGSLPHAVSSSDPPSCNGPANARSPELLNPT